MPLAKMHLECHNPYFNRWFSAMITQKEKHIMKDCHNPYFNRWFSAISDEDIEEFNGVCHNPYFNRWFSAIFAKSLINDCSNVTILILIDGFLQYKGGRTMRNRFIGHNPYFNRWFSAI